MHAFTKISHHTAHLFLNLLLLVVTVSVFVPFSPKMPAPGLDPSWALALNQAVAQGLSFGKELIFSLGPYSSIYTKAYHPATDHLMIMGCLYLAFTYWLGLMFLMKGGRGYWALVFSVLLFFMIYSRDALFFSYPLLTGLVCFKSQSSNEYSKKYAYLLLGLLFASFGLLSLVKSSALILCFVVSILCTLFFMLHHKKAFALIALFCPLIALIFLWLLIGQSVTNIPYYFINTITMVSGFTEAMSLDGNESELILYVVNAALILLAIACQKQMQKSTKLFLLALFFMFLLISLKTGFTRHYGHALISGTSIVIAALFLPFILKSKGIFALIICSIGTWYYINSHYTQISIQKNFTSNYTAAWYGLKNRLKDSHSLKEDFEFSMIYLNQRANLPALPGTTDIYSYNQSYLIASDNHWSPRPVFQSYSVFNAALAEKNKHYLQAKTRPDNIIFQIEPIDERVPSLEDGSSWPLLLSLYHPISLHNNFLILRKNEPPESARKLISITKEQHRLGEQVLVPSTQHQVIAEIEIKPSLWGRLVTFLFKPKQLHIIFTLKDGTKRYYRFIANMAKSGFLMSPLIENTTEFALLYGKKNILKDKEVHSFRIATKQKNNGPWQNEYKVHFKEIPYDV